MLSCQQTQNVIDDKKRIILNPNESQRRDFESATFAENEVYGMDILVSSGDDGKVSIFASSPDLTFNVSLPGSGGRIANHNLPARAHGHLPTQTKKFSRRVL